MLLSFPPEKLYELELTSEEAGTSDKGQLVPSGSGRTGLRRNGTFEPLLCRWTCPACPSSWRCLASLTWSSGLPRPAATGTSTSWEGSHSGLWAGKNSSDPGRCLGFAGWAGTWAGVWEWKELRRAHRRLSPGARGHPEARGLGAGEGRDRLGGRGTQTMQSEIGRNKNGLSYLLGCFIGMWHFSVR